MQTSTPSLKDAEVERLMHHSMRKFMDYLDLFQSGFKPEYGSETALNTLVDDSGGSMKGWCIIVALLHLSPAFDTIYHIIFLDLIQGSEKFNVTLVLFS